MMPGTIGLLVGLLIGVASWRTLSVLSQRVDKPETKRLLSVVGLIELVLMPALGYVIGALAFG